MKINYRPEIDGLRAIAVIAVIIYHAQISLFDFQLFQGGFLGVDIFFVISGYLITSIILKEFLVKGSFSFKSFIQRRIRRIIPVLLVVILFSIPLAYLYLIPKSLVDYSWSILSTLGFYSNFYFPISGQPYGDQDSLLKPFLHTWSLSVEEQFYILFPIFLMICFKFIKRYTLLSIILIFIFSLFFSEIGSKNFPGFNFYLIFSRGWELLSGSFLAFIEIKYGYRKKNNTFISFFPTVGLFLIFFSIFSFNHQIKHPSLFTIIPIFGVCLLIWFTQKDEFITKILSSKVFVSLGLISYSLYLWHYPIFAFARITYINNGNFFKIILVGLILISLSIASYYLVEKPARNKKIKFKLIFVIISIIYLFLVLINFTIIHKKGLEGRFYSSENYKFSNFEHEKKSDEFENSYNYNNYDHRKNVLIVGNSHSEDFLKIISLTNLTKKIYFNLTSLDSETLNFQLTYLNSFLKNRKSLNSIYNNDYISQLSKKYDMADLILVTTLYSNEDVDILDELIKKIVSDDKKIIVFNNGLVQETKNNLNRLDYFVFKNNRLPNKKELEIIEKNIFKDLEKNKIINKRIKEIGKKNQIKVFDKEDLFCEISKKKCRSITDDGFKLYWDSEHITEKGALFFAKKIEKNQIFLNYLNFYLDLN